MRRGREVALTARPCIGRVGPLAFLLLLSGLAVAGEGDGPFYYYVEDEKIVVTNTPSRRDLRPVPGMETPGGEVTGAAMPATPYDAFIDRVAREYGISPDLVKAVALVESGFDPHAVSPKGARGLMQLMPATGRRYGVRDLFDPLENLRAGIRHLRNLLDEFGGNVTLALAAYNAGSGAVRRHGGVPAYAETRAYVNKVRESMGQLPRRSRPKGSRSAPAGDEVRLTRREDGTLALIN